MILDMKQTATKFYVSCRGLQKRQVLDGLGDLVEGAVDAVAAAEGEAMSRLARISRFLGPYHISSKVWPDVTVR